MTFSDYEILARCEKLPIKSEDLGIPFEDWPIEEQNEFMKEYYPWKDHGGSFGADTAAEKKIIDDWIKNHP